MKRRHTKRDLTRMFKERGLRANRLLGQHFLVDHNILEFICTQGGLLADDAVLEIGAGTGLLTEHLARAGAQVVAVEIDPNLFEIAAEYIGDEENVHLLNCDIHGERRQINPKVEAALDKVTGAGRTLKVISNLPYCISSDLLVSLLEMRRPVERMVLTVQKEFADRMLARPGSRDYGPLTVLLGARAEVKRLKNLPPSVFWPVPNVGSSIVTVVPDGGRLAAIADYGLFKSVVAGLFAHRRKTAASALRTMTRPRLSKERVAAAFVAAGILPDTRADGLSIAQIITLSKVLAERS